jgi:hypothetical protein
MSQPVTKHHELDLRPQVVQKLPQNPHGMPQSSFASKNSDRTTQMPVQIPTNMPHTLASKNLPISLTNSVINSNHASYRRTGEGTGTPQMNNSTYSGRSINQNMVGSTATHHFQNSVHLNSV